MCGVVAVLFLPIVLGPIGIFLATKAKSNHEPRGDLALKIAIGGMVLGFIFGFLFVAANG